MIYQLDNVSKEYHTRHGLTAALRDLTFSIGPGEQVALLGPSGAGKTTLFRLLNGTLRASGGVLSFEGKDVNRLSRRGLRAMRRSVGTIYQQHHLVPSLSALENTLCGKLGSWTLLQTMRSMVRPSAIWRPATT